MGWFGKKKDEEKAALNKAHSEVLREIVKQFAPEHIGIADDNIYLRLPEKKVKDFVWKYHNSNAQFVAKPEVMDCDDAVALAKADIIKGMQDAGLDSPIVFGKMVWHKKDGKRHAVAWTVTDEDKILIYDAVTQKWHDKLPAEVAKVLEVSF